MLTLQTQTCYLRALEPEDLDFIYDIENDESVWEVSNTITPYSRFLIKEYLDNAHKDIFEVKQLRFVICDNSNRAVGLVDLFDFDPHNRRAGVGVLINDETSRAKGFGKAALEMVINYSFKHLNLHQLYCNISEDNLVSIKLFEQLGFKQIGIKKDWNFRNGSYKDEYLYQLITHVH
jgi:diamine N-acetyltransferase